MQDDPKKIMQLVKKLKAQLDKEVRDVLPRRVGVKAVNLVKQNFRDGGFHDGGLRPWQKSKRELAGDKRAGSRYGTLLSARNHLMSSTQYRPVTGGVMIENLVPYARIHNEGGTLTVSPTITPKMRRFAWAMAYKSMGRRKGKKKGKGSAMPLNDEAKKWLALALTKKTKLTIRAKMPRRQFIGESKDLSAIVEAEIKVSIEDVNFGTYTLLGTQPHYHFYLHSLFFTQVADSKNIKGYIVSTYPFIRFRSLNQHTLEKAPICFRREKNRLSRTLTKQFLQVE